MWFSKINQNVGYCWLQNSLCIHIEIQSAKKPDSPMHGTREESSPDQGKGKRDLNQSWDEGNYFMDKHWRGTKWNVQ